MRISIWLAAAVGGAVAFSMAEAATVREATGVYVSKERKSGTLHPGARVTLLQESGEWFKIRYETMDALFEGYVRRAVLDIAPGEAANPEAQPAQAAAAEEPPAEAPPPDRPAAEPAPQLQLPAMTAELGLGTYWNVQSKSGSLAADSLQAMLRKFGKPQVQTKASSNYVLYKDLYYLMPLAEAAKIFSQPRLTGKNLAAPGFPNGSFKLFTFVAPADGFSQVTLVGDTKNQLVAVQLSDVGEKGLWLKDRFREHYQDAREYSNDLRLYNVLDGSLKSSSSWRVGYGMKSTNGVLRIDTELVSPVGDKDRQHELRSKERTRLYLPQPIVDLCLHLLSSR